MTRVAVFIDYQNVYMSARRAFGFAGTPDFTLGQVYPRRVGLLLTERGRSMDANRQLEVVRILRGEPSPQHNPKGQAACQRQVRYWKAQGRVEPFTRPLKYYAKGVDHQGNVLYDAREKGIDVQIALDMVMGAREDVYDVAVLFSGDTDLIPAIEAVHQLGKRVEVAAWKSPTHYSPRLKPPKLVGVWCHWLDLTDYGKLADPTDYTYPQPGEPQSNP